MADIIDKIPKNAEQTIFTARVNPEKLNTCIDDILSRLSKLEISTRSAKWVLFDKDSVGRAFYCSNCHKVTTTDDFESSPLEREEYFCPRCGARMDGEQNDDRR